MNDIIKPIIYLATNDKHMFFVGLAEFILCTVFAFLLFLCLAQFENQSKVVKFAIVINAFAWALLVILGILLIPNETNGTYLDVYANLALANIGFMMILALLCGSLAVSNFITGIIFTLVFGATFAMIGGKGIGDLVSPKAMHVQIDWLSFDDTDKNLGSLRVGIVEDDYQQVASIKLAEKLQQEELLATVDFSDGDDIVPPIKMDLVQAPYTGVLYLPEEYGFTRYGKTLFYGLLGIWVMIITTAMIMLISGKKS